MAKPIRVTGFDPSMTHWGWCKADYYPNTDDLNVFELGVIITKPNNKKETGLRVNSDDIARAFKLISNAHEATLGSQLVFAEVPTFSRNQRAAVSNGMGYMGLAALKYAGINLVQISPEQLKLATIGSPTAKKQEIIDRAVSLWPNLNWPIHKKKGIIDITSSKAEHMADAIGAVEAGIKTEEFQAILSIAKSM